MLFSDCCLNGNITGFVWPSSLPSGPGAVDSNTEGLSLFTISSTLLSVLCEPSGSLLWLSMLFEDCCLCSSPTCSVLLDFVDSGFDNNTDGLSLLTVSCTVTSLSHDLCSVVWDLAAPSLGSASPVESAPVCENTFRTDVDVETSLALSLCNPYSCFLSTARPARPDRLVGESRREELALVDGDRDGDEDTWRVGVVCLTCSWSPAWCQE